MGFFEIIDKLDDWLSDARREKIDMSELDYADDNTREYWTLLYNSDPKAFSQEKIDIIEEAFIYNQSIEIYHDGESAQPRIRTVNLMHPEYSVELLRTMSEAMKLGINLKTCSIQPHRWRPEVFGALNYGFQKSINIIESSNNYINPELIGIINAKEKGINLTKYIPKHQYSDTLPAETAYKLLNSGTLSEKACLRGVDFLNKGNFFELYELAHIIHYIMLGGNPNELINKFCRNQHLYNLSYKNKKGQLINNEKEVKEKDDKMAQFVKDFGLRRLREKEANSIDIEFCANQVIEIVNMQPQNREQKIVKKQDTKTPYLDIFDEFLKEDYVDDNSDEEAESAAIKAEEERIMNLYRKI